MEFKDKVNQEEIGVKASLLDFGDLIAIIIEVNSMVVSHVSFFQCVGISVSIVTSAIAGKVTKPGCILESTFLTHSTLVIFAFDTTVLKLL